MAKITSAFGKVKALGGGGGRKTGGAVGGGLSMGIRGNKLGGGVAKKTSMQKPAAMPMKKGY